VAKLEAETEQAGKLKGKKKKKDAKVCFLCVAMR
jgi:hypothetical protein